jgi:hypothetical protein
MMKRTTCAECGVALKKDEIALSKKMLGKTTPSFYCINCLATELDCEAEDLQIKMQEFKEQGCTLFL